MSTPETGGHKAPRARSPFRRARSPAVAAPCPRPSPSPSAADVGTNGGEDALDAAARAFLHQPATRAALRFSPRGGFRSSGRSRLRTRLRLRRISVDEGGAERSPPERPDEANELLAVLQAVDDPAREPPVRREEAPLDRVAADRLPRDELAVGSRWAFRSRSTAVGPAMRSQRVSDKMRLVW